jgi:hypothetical protein
MQKLLASDGEEHDYFGCSVSIVAIILISELTKIMKIVHCPVLSLSSTMMNSLLKISVEQVFSILHSNHQNPSIHIQQFFSQLRQAEATIY